MAIEVQAMKYMFLGVPKAGVAQAKPVFLHNYLHDMESLWWILIYYVVSLPSTCKKPDAFHDIFNHGAQLTMERQFFFKGIFEYSEYMQTITLSTSPEPVQDALQTIIDLLQKARIVFVTGYTRLETLETFPCEAIVKDDSGKTVDIFANVTRDVLNIFMECCAPAVVLTEHFGSTEQKIWQTPASKRDRDDEKGGSEGVKDRRLAKKLKS